MKKMQLLFSALLLIASQVAFANKNCLIKPPTHQKNSKDTVEFTLRWDFTGDCGTDCYKFIGTGIISKINGKAAGKNCHHIFVQCPSGLNLKEGKIYKFVAVGFTPNSCSTVIDNCTKSKTYLLLKEIN